MSEIDVESSVPSQYGRPLVRTVPSWVAPKIHGRITEINKKAEKLGLPPFLLKSGAPYLVPHGDYVKAANGVKVEMIDFEIAGVQIKVDGHRLVGRVDFEEGEILVSSRPGDQIPASYRAATPMCDHCGLDRRRNAVFVFRRDDESCIQVGRSCMQDFLGYDPAAALWAASAMETICEEFDEESWTGFNHAELISVVEIMQASACSVRLHGFTSKGVQQNKAADGINVTATADEVFEILFPPRNPPKDYVRIVPNEHDIEKAKAVMAWVEESWGGLADPSDYQHNAITMVRMMHVSTKRIGLLCSLVGSFDKEMGLRVERAKRINRHVGTVGERREFTAVFAGYNAFESQFGTLFIARFDSPEGLLVYKGGTPFWPTGCKTGDEVVFVGSIKEHGEYHSMRQTYVSRCKLGPAPVKVPKVKKARAVKLQQQPLAHAHI